MATNDVGGITDRNVLNTEYKNLDKQLDIIEKNLNAMYSNLHSLNKAGWHGGNRAYNVYTNIAANYKNNVAKVKVFEKVLSYLNKYRRALNGAADYK
jgi:hypothetical protein